MTVLSKLWDIENGICVKELVENFEIVTSIRSGRHNDLISCSDDGQIKVWNLETGRCINTIICDE